MSFSSQEPLPLNVRSIKHEPSSWFASCLLVLLLSMIFIGPMLWFHYDSLRNLISFHGTLHVAIAQQFARSQFPPENPFYAGEAVGYYWFFHYVSYLMAGVLHIDILHAIEYMSLVALVGLIAIAVTLGRKLWGSAVAGACLGFLVLVGANGLGWLILLAKIIRDGPQIMSAPASAVVGPLLLQVQYGDHRFGPNFTYYYHMTSRPIALTLCLAMLACIYGMFQRRSLLASMCLVLSTALCVAFNPLIGLAASGALVGGVIMNKVFQAYGKSSLILDKESENTTLFTCGAIVVGAACAWPTFSHLLTGGNRAGIHFAPFRWKLYGIVLANVSVLVPLIWMGYRRLDAQNVGFARSAITGGVLLVVGTLLFAMPGTLSETGRTGNEHNLFNTAMVLLAVTASGAVMRLKSSNKSDYRSSLVTWRVIALFLFFLPTTVLIMSSYLNRAPVRVTLDREGMAWQDLSLPMAKFYTWVSEATATDSVFIVTPDQAPPRLCNVSDFPAFTQRALFTDERSYMTEGYKDAQYRSELSKRLASGQGMASFDHAYLKQLDRPIYVTSYAANDVMRFEALSSAYGEPSYVEGHIATFRLAP